MSTGLGHKTNLRLQRLANDLYRYGQDLHEYGQSYPVDYYLYDQGSTIKSVYGTKTLKHPTINSTNSHPTNMTGYRTRSASYKTSH